ncbi:MAG: cupredoxin domain-containing protein [Planctomycetes bacterium]|nr:cupredoxin domain-containing protein [Planctomycetota bacterium]
MNRRRTLIVVGLVALSIVVFGALASYGWWHRYGPGPGVAVQAFPRLGVPYLPRPLEMDDRVAAAPVWAELPSLDVRMMHQVTETPWPTELIAQVRVRAFHDGRDFYCRLEWADAQANIMTAPGQFTDACALAMPLANGPPSQSIMMGFSSLVNFWHWRADLDAEVWNGAAASSPAYTDHLNPFEDKEVLAVTTPKPTTAVTDMLAARPGSLTRKDRQAVLGRGGWRDGRWCVVFKRAMRTDDSQTDVQIQPGLRAAAFAAWNGQNKDRGARKSISDWVILDIAAPPASPADSRAESRTARSAGRIPASLLGGLLAGVSTAEPERPREITIVAKRFEFNPSTITLRHGELVTLRLESLDVTHGLYLDGYDVQTKARPGVVGKVTFRADKPGRFSFRCSETCGEFHPYMIGYLSVTPNSPFHVMVLIIIATAVLVAAGMFIIRLRRKRTAA